MSVNAGVSGDANYPSMPLRSNRFRVQLRHFKGSAALNGTIHPSIVTRVGGGARKLTACCVITIHNLAGALHLQPTGADCVLSPPRRHSPSVTADEGTPLSGQENYQRRMKPRSAACAALAATGLKCKRINISCFYSTLQNSKEATPLKTCVYDFSKRNIIGSITDGVLKISSWCPLAATRSSVSLLPNVSLMRR